METIYSHARHSESWIEVSSQASSSQASSLHGDEPRRHPQTLPNDPLARRRRRLLRNTASNPTNIVQARTASTATSSQEEYEESDSASDRILTSSNENISHPSEGSSPVHIVSPPPLPSQPNQTGTEDEEEDDDENATALGIGTIDRVFTPAANAFSHPSTTTTTLRQHQTSSLETRTTTSYFPPSPRRPSFASNTTTRPTGPRRSSGGTHTPYTTLSPSHRTDHDAALRASLSTLLSCARALPKRHTTAPSPPSNEAKPAPVRGAGQHHPNPSAIAPSTLHLIPPGSDPTAASSDADKPSRRQRNRSPPKTAKRTKRTTSTATPELAGSTQLIPPHLLTWVVSAGVVVLFSAIGFSAGYVIGKEVGRVEVVELAGGKDVGRGLRRLGRGVGGRVVRVV